MKLFYLNPTYPELDLEENVLKGTGIELVRHKVNSDADIASFVRALWHVRADRYSELRTEDTLHLPKVEMSHIGG